MQNDQHQMCCTEIKEAIAKLFLLPFVAKYLPTEKVLYITETLSALLFVTDLSSYCASFLRHTKISAHSSVKPQHWQPCLYWLWRCVLCMRMKYRFKEETSVSFLLYVNYLTTRALILSNLDWCTSKANSIVIAFNMHKFPEMIRGH